MSNPPPPDDNRDALAALAARYLDVWERNVSALAVAAPATKPAERS